MIEKNIVNTRVQMSHTDNKLFTLSFVFIHYYYVLFIQTYLLSYFNSKKNYLNKYINFL